MLKFDNIINNINTLQLALEDNQDLVRPSLNLICSFNKIKQELLKIKYNVNKKKVLSFIETYQRTTENSINLIITESIYENYNIDNFFDFILKIINAFKPSILSISDYSSGSLKLSFNNLDINKVVSIFNNQTDLLFSVKEDTFLVLENIGSLEKFLIVESKFGKVAVPFFILNIELYNKNILKANIYNKLIDLDFRIQELSYSYRKKVESIYNNKIFDGVFLDKQQKIIPVLSLAYLYKN